MQIARRKGTVTIEFALIALLLLVLLFWIIDLGIMFYVNLTMQSAVREGARYSVLGLNNLDPILSSPVCNPSSPLYNPSQCQPSQRAAVIQKIRQQSLGFYDKYCTSTTPPLSPVFSYLEGPNDTTPTIIPANATTLGGPDQIIIISVTCKWPVLTPLMKTALPNGIYNFTVKATMKNEPS